MEELKDIEEQIQKILNKPIKYFAEFKPDSGRVFRVGPSQAFNTDAKNVISIDEEIAYGILEGRVKLSDCYVDLKNSKFEILKDKTVKSIDDLLHRIIEKEWTTIDNPSVVVSYENNTLTIELSEEYGGTYVLPENYQPVETKKLMWADNTDMNLLLTDYNDPHYVHRVFSFKLAKLQRGPITFSDVEFIKNQHSLYTKRLFENYIMEIK